jgi:hypothetical protein
MCEIMIKVNCVLIMINTKVPDKYDKYEILIWSA